LIIAQEKPNYAYSECPVKELRPKPEVKTQSERQARVLLTVMILSAFLLGALYIYFNAQITGVGYRLENMKRQVAAIDVENQSLEMLISRQDSLARVEALATTRLGMVLPKKENVLTIALTGTAVSEEPEAVQIGGVESVPAQVAEGGLVHEDALEMASEPSLLEAFLSLISGWEQKVRTA
jgi:cell division protein FtsL